MKAKEIIKELIIFLLLLLAIILVLGVLLYEYVPSNKIIPEKVSYTTPSEIKEELQTDNSVDNQEVVVTYKIDSTDLSNYKKIQEYDPGSKNPFASLSQQENTVEGGNTTTSGSTSSSNNSNQGSTSNNKETSNANGTTKTTSQSSSSGYLPDKGTK